MLNKYGERTRTCRTPSLTGNHSDSVPATLTLTIEKDVKLQLTNLTLTMHLFPVQFVSTSMQRISHVHHSYPELIMMRDRVERLLEVHEARIEWLLMLACLVHQYS